MLSGYLTDTFGEALGSLFGVVRLCHQLGMYTSGTALPCLRVSAVSNLFKMSASLKRQHRVIEVIGSDTMDF